MVLELVWSKKGIKGGENHVFVGWTGMTSKNDRSGDNSVEIDPTFALNLGIQSKQKVSHLFLVQKEPKLWHYGASAQTGVFKNEPSTLALSDAWAA